MPRQLLPVQLPPGVVKGATPAATPGRWFDANLMRWNGGVMQPIGGWEAIVGAAFPAPVRELLTWRDNGGQRWAGCGLGNGEVWVFNFDTATKTRIDTPGSFVSTEPPGPPSGYGLGDYSAELYGTPRDTGTGLPPVNSSALLGDWWSFALFGQDLLVVSSNEGHLWRWSPTTPATPLAIVPGAPTGNRLVIVTEERHVVLAGAGSDPRRVQWSSQENPTDWTPTSTNTAGDLQINSEGMIMSVSHVAGGTLILTETDAHSLRYVGAPYVYGLQKVGESCGPVSPHAVASTVNVTAWMGPQGFFTWDGAPRTLPCDVQDWLFSIMNRDKAGSIFGVALPNFRELWWYFSDDSSTEPNRYVIWNYGENHWSVGRMTRTASDLVGITNLPIMAGLDGKLYLHEVGWLADNQPRLGEVYAESGDLTLGEGERTMHVVGLIPDIIRAGDAASYTLMGKWQPTGDEWTEGPFLYNTRGDGRIDCRFSARSVRVRIEANRDIDFAVGRPRLEIARAGGRR
jgi:hypothetical protein